MNIDIINRFNALVDKSGDCWMFTGNKNRGYGKFSINNRGEYAHRVSYEIEYGSIPDGMCVCHSCDNPSCVNPAHLFAATHSENMGDMYAKGRGVKRNGHLNPAAKLSRTDVKEIRERYKPYRVTQKMLASEYGVSVSAINKIVCGITHN